MRVVITDDPMIDPDDLEDVEVKCAEENEEEFRKVLANTQEVHISKSVMAKMIEDGINPDEIISKLMSLAGRQN